MPEGTSPVIYEQDGAVVTMTLNRPEKMNNFGGGLIEALKAGFERFRDDDSARVAIVTGSGKAFCAGGDLEAMARRAHEGADPRLRQTPEQRRRDFFRPPRVTHLTDI